MLRRNNEDDALLTTNKEAHRAFGVKKDSKDDKEFNKKRTTKRPRNYNYCSDPNH